jgi:hypothetical protein
MYNTCIPLSNNSQNTNMDNFLNYNSQSSNWSDSLHSNECPKDLFRQYSQLQSSKHNDCNLNGTLNPSIDSMDNNSFNKMQLGCNISPNFHGNSILNMYNSYNVTTNGQGCLFSETVTDFNTVAGLISNSTLQHFSSVDSTLQNCYANHFQCNKYEEVS